MRAVIEGDAEIETISLEDAPPEVRARIEEAEFLPEGGTVYVGPDGKHRVFRVLDDAPPDIQRKIRELRRRGQARGGRPHDPGGRADSPGQDIHTPGET